MTNSPRQINDRRSYDENPGEPFREPFQERNKMTVKSKQLTVDSANAKGTTEGRPAMEHIMIWLRTDDYDRWQGIHDSFVEERKAYGITDDFVYRDVNDPSAALVHLVVEDAPRAMQWTQTDKFKTGTIAAKVTDRAVYVAERRV